MDANFHSSIRPMPDSPTAPALWISLFEREDQGSEGPHALNRSFKGTY